MDQDLNCIKGGGACQLREKVLAEAAKTFVLVADYRKNSARLGTNVSRLLQFRLFVAISPFYHLSFLSQSSLLTLPSYLLSLTSAAVESRRTYRSRTLRVCKSFAQSPEQFGLEGGDFEDGEV